MFLFLSNEMYARDSSDNNSPNGSSDFFDDEDLFDYQATANEEGLDDTGSTGYSDSDFDDLDDA